MLTRLITITIFSLNLLLPCAVCYGNPESPMAQGMNMGILTLMAFIVFILCIIAYSIISFSLRIKNIKHLKGRT
tara:strand:- start:1397 stop:1618 length:222 start_codon:yes stop_codon:yes gene_type:complete